MSYIDALKVGDTIHIAERDANGIRKIQKFPAKYTMYVKHPTGDCLSLYGDKLLKYEYGTYKEHNKEVKQTRPGMLFEHDINPVFRFLEENYSGAELPNLHVAFFDIEVDFNPIQGFSSPEDPYCEVNAISVYQTWTGECHTVVLKPETIRSAEGDLIPLTWEHAEEICATFDNTILCKNELELYDIFFELIHDADIVSGWNSTGFDIPYLVKRLERIKHKDRTKKFCLFGQFPRKRNFEKFGKEQFTYDLYGRVHLDYLDLYQKHTYHEMHSYSLDAVGEHEVGERKVSYEGSLDMLYKADFPKFIDYNRQDTMLLVKIDNKNKFIDLSNALAHEMTVTLQTTLGSVALIETAICKEMHTHGLIAPSKKKSADDSTAVAGAFVATPVRGMHNWVGSVDINSLYPSVIRSLNISPETIVGQVNLRRTMKHISDFLAAKSTNTLAEAWGPFFGVFEYDTLITKSTEDFLTVNLEDGTNLEQTAENWYNTIFSDDSNMCVSGNGTIFRTDKKGIIPGLLERWYNERVEIRKEAKILFGEMERLPEGDEKKELKEHIAFLDQRQLIKKILLNSLYGALLNPYCRFFDQRMGQSVTLTGRCITKHMMAKMNELFTDEYDHKGETIIYGDTDSAYVSAYPVFKDVEGFDWSADNVIQLYDTVSEQMNDSFPQYMVDAFHTTLDNGKIIEAGREVVAQKGIFIKKKRYALLCNDIEGRRFDQGDDPGLMKAMGVELKRSDTPATIQVFLKDILMKTLSGTPEEEIRGFIKEFRDDFRTWKGWEKGTPKRVNNLTEKVAMEEKFGRVNMAGHQRASMEWNKMKKRFKDNYSMEIQDGFKVVVCKLKKHPLKITSIAYPVDQEHLPDWFKELPFDHDAMEEALIDKKIENILGVLKWKLKRPEETRLGIIYFRKK